MLEVKLRGLLWRLQNIPGEDVGIAGGYGWGVNANFGAPWPALFTELWWPEDDYPQLQKPALASAAEVDRLEIPDPARVELVGRMVHFAQYFKEIVGDRLPVGAGGFNATPFTNASTIMPMGQLLMDLRDCPEHVHRLLQLMVDTYIAVAAYIRRQLNLSMPESIGCPDDACGNIAPQDYETFAVPYILQCARRGSTSGQVIRIHLCGRSQHLWPSMARLLRPRVMEISPFGDLMEARRVFGPDTILVGNMDPRIVREGSKEQIREATLACLRQGMTTPGRYYFMAGTAGWDMPIRWHSNSETLGTPLENINYVNSLVLEHGRYA
jgi:uroporphyrinogen decarboxylase